MTFPSIIAIPVNGVQIEAKFRGIESMNGEQHGRYEAETGDIIFLSKDNRITRFTQVAKSIDQLIGGTRGKDHQSAGIHTGESRQRS